MEETRGCGGCCGSSRGSAYQQRETQAEGLVLEREQQPRNHSTGDVVVAALGRWHSDNHDKSSWFSSQHQTEASDQLTASERPLYCQRRQEDKSAREKNKGKGLRLPATCFPVTWLNKEHQSSTSGLFISSFHATLAGQSKSWRLSNYDHCRFYDRDSVMVQLSTHNFVPPRWW